MALIGLLSLGGMLIRNGIVLVEEIEQQKQEKAAGADYLCRHVAFALPILLTAFYHRPRFTGPLFWTCLPEHGGCYACLVWVLLF